MFVTRQRLNIGGLNTNVYSAGDLMAGGRDSPLAALLMIHGRVSSSEAQDIDSTARTAFAWTDNRRVLDGMAQRDFIVITLVGVALLSHSDLSLWSTPVLMITSAIVGPEKPW